MQVQRGILILLFAGYFFPAHAQVRIDHAKSPFSYALQSAQTEKVPAAGEVSKKLFFLSNGTQVGSSGVLFIPPYTQGFFCNFEDYLNKGHSLRLDLGVR